MLGLTKVYFIIFGLLTIAGGAMGYVKAGSTASIIAGSISGVLLILSGFLVIPQPATGLVLGGLVSLLLIGYFLPAFFRTGKLMPAGLMSLLSIIGVVIAIVAWVRR
jgi:uncharacterized membrane protein (UPF0136 family)